MGKKVTSIRIDPSTWEEFKKRCEKLGMSMSNVLRDLIEKWLEDTENKEPPKRFNVYTLPKNGTLMEVVCDCGELLGLVRIQKYQKDLEKLLESLNYTCPRCGRKLDNNRAKIEF